MATGPSRGAGMIATRDAPLPGCMLTLMSWCSLTMCDVCVNGEMVVMMFLWGLHVSRRKGRPISDPSSSTGFFHGVERSQLFRVGS